MAGVHLRAADPELPGAHGRLAPDAVLNLGHRDAQVITAARAAGVPIRVARSRGRQIWQATHVLWKGRYGSGRHEAQNVLDFLKPWGWEGGFPAPPRSRLTPEERERGAGRPGPPPRPRAGRGHPQFGLLGLPFRRLVGPGPGGRCGPGAGTPSSSPRRRPRPWPATDLRGLMGRIRPATPSWAPPRAPPSWPRPWTCRCWPSWA